MRYQHCKITALDRPGPEVTACTGYEGVAGQSRRLSGDCVAPARKEQSTKQRLLSRRELIQTEHLIALKRRALETPVAAVGPEKTAAFSAALQAKLRDTENPTFRRAYLRLMLDKVVVGKAAISISGPKAVLTHQLSTENPLPPSLVPTLMDNWRARRDSNS
jgi:hypothetical protein